MGTRSFDFQSPLQDHRGIRQHRFMESADINAAFHALFGPMRVNIRRGLTCTGQVYALEMDACVPGELLATAWIPPAAVGIADPALLADAARRRTVLDRLLAAPRQEALLAYAGERPAAAGSTLLYVEVVSCDGRYAAEYPIRPGRGWHRRELVRTPHRRLQAAAID
jgi:hypothetical protein